MSKSRIAEDDPQADRRLVWLGGRPVSESVGRKTRLILPGHSSDQTVTLATQQVQWLERLIRQSAPHSNRPRPYPLLRETKITFPGTVKEFESFVSTTSWKKLRSAGLLLV